MGIVSLDIRQRETAEEIWALQHPAYRLEAALIGVSDLPPLRDTIQSLQECGETFLGYRDSQGDLVGAVSCEKEKLEHYTICRLMVHPEHLRQGIGSLLMVRLLSEKPRNATWTVTAEVRNLPAIALYERFDFIRQETFKPIPSIEMLRLVRAPHSS
ncbi:GNAT family N-acetyltransferase [Cohnella luojiensis]|uniref:GNAT family N-acetyltransferase n=1 Tax=Cohnella luojiensis TaxID=652876 RepID=UPI0014317483|nr:GNAT family N-acetyltransferase [Cohnella luojiensis]